MRDFNKEDIHPDDFWPEAGKLLDHHFAQKRKRRYLIFFAFFLSGVMGVLYLLDRNTNTNGSMKAEKEASHAAAVTALHPTPAPATATMTVPADDQRLQRPVEEKYAGTAHGAENDKAMYGAPIPSSAHQHISSHSQPNSLPDVTDTMTTASPADEGLLTEEITPLPLKLLMESMPAIPVELLTKEEPAPWLKRKSAWDMVLYAGAGWVNKDMYTAGNTSYLDRREQEEKPANQPFAGWQLSKSVRNWDFRGGIEFSVIGEQVKYSPYSNGQYYNSYQEWEPYSYVVSDTDSTYIFGILFLNTRLETVTDSNYVTKTDTLSGKHYDPAVTYANGINRWYIMELPLEVLYRVKTGRWGIGLSAGLAPGVVVRSSGHYLKDDESGITKFEKENTGRLTLNARAGIEFSYLLHANCRLLLRPSVRYFLTEMDGGGNTRQRYNMVGISAGILYRIR